ncbi:3-oxo-5-alpha-steroid 4-dehydrogenase [Actinidia rufa]|uniref:3-oxo-5-alpha-steroid 4-dehydrogenase n=1 Tax=Actinidia rufa TaxID=165716 RepID=A0A7J0DFU0_9ERIC|nr:3-oxo-5-alpha-steroid 4-dehydrogenase [Actinidia rufa]
MEAALAKAEMALAIVTDASVGYQFFFFIITALLKFDKVTDFAGSTNFIILSVLTLVLKGSWHSRQFQILNENEHVIVGKGGLSRCDRPSGKMVDTLNSMAGDRWRWRRLEFDKVALQAVSWDLQRGSLGDMLGECAEEMSGGRYDTTSKVSSGRYDPAFKNPKLANFLDQTTTEPILNMLVLGCLDLACSHMGSSAGAISIDEWGEDRRFDEMRGNLGKLAIFWTFQAVWVWTVSLPVTIVNASDRDLSLQAVDIIGWIMWSIGITVEAIADQQKLTFKNSQENRGKWCSVGLWKYTRHPNYFGEILLWWGIFVASTPVLEGGEWLVILGPLFLTLLLLFISGIPLLEESADKKFGNVAGYRVYKSTTSPLIPLPPLVYGNLPSWFKKAFLLELPFYNQNLPQEGLNW